MLLTDPSVVNHSFVTKVTIFDSTDTVVKRFTVNKVDGSIDKDGVPLLYSGKFSTHAIASLADFMTLRATLTSDQCVSFGTFDIESGEVSTDAKVKRATGSRTKTLRARSRENMKFREPLALLCFDMDSAQSLDSAIAGLRATVPAFAEGGVEFAVVRSNSGRVSLAGEDAPVEAKWHVFCFGESSLMTDAQGRVKPFGMTLLYRAWLAGFGDRKISESGAYLHRAMTVDESVFQPERIFYEGTPVVGDGVVLHDNPTLFFNAGTGRYLTAADTSISRADTRAALALIDADRRACAALCSAATERYVDTETAARNKRGIKQTRDDVARELKATRETQTVSLDFIVRSETEGTITVRELIAIAHNSGYQKVKIKPPFKPSAKSYNAYLEYYPHEGVWKLRDHSPGEASFYRVTDADLKDATAEARIFYARHASKDALIKAAKAFESPPKDRSQVSLSGMLGAKWPREVAALFWSHLPYAYAVLSLSYKNAVVPPLAQLRSYATSTRNETVLRALRMFDAEFEAHKAARLSCVRIPESECVEVPDLTLEGKPRVFVDNSTTGTGKSTFYIEALKTRAAAEGRPLIVITPLQSLCADVAGRFGLESYTTDNLQSRAVVVCLPSLMKGKIGEFLQDTPYVVIDEFDAVLQSLGSPGLLKREGRESDSRGVKPLEKLDAFTVLLRDAAQAVLLSSTATREHVAVVEDLIGAARGEVPTYFKRAAKPVFSAVTVGAGFDHGAKLTHRAKLKQSERKWLEMGASVFEYYAAKTLCDTNGADLTETTDLPTLTVTSDATKEKEGFLAAPDVNAYVGQFRRLACTSAISSGLSITDPAYAYTAMYLNARSNVAVLRQACHRARGAKVIRIAGQMNTQNIREDEVLSVENRIIAHNLTQITPADDYVKFQKRMEWISDMQKLDSQRTLVWRLLEEGATFVSDDGEIKTWAEKVLYARVYSMADLPDSGNPKETMRAPAVARAQVADILKKRRNARLTLTDVNEALDRGWTPPAGLQPEDDAKKASLPSLDQEIQGNDAKFNTLLSDVQKAAPLTGFEFSAAKRASDNNVEPSCGNVRLSAARIRDALLLDADAVLTDTQMYVSQQSVSRVVAARQTIDMDFATMDAKPGSDLGELRVAVLSTWQHLTPDVQQRIGAGVKGEDATFGEVELDNIANAMFIERRALANVHGMMTETWLNAKQFERVKDKARAAARFLRLMGVGGDLSTKTGEFKALAPDYLVSAWKPTAGGKYEERMLSTGHAVMWAQVCDEITRLVYGEMPFQERRAA